MKKFILSIILAIFLIVSPASAEFFPDVIVTSPNGIWTDSRAYNTLNDAITAVGANERTIRIVSPQVVTTLTVPSNVTLEFIRDGSITNSGQLTLNTKNIIAPNRQIFTGVGNIDFDAGSVVKTGWFSNIETAFALTDNDEITLIVSKPQTITASYSPGDDVHLKWENPGNILTVNAAVVVGNLKNIEAGNYQLFAGAGDFDFLDGTELKLNWFNQLSSVLTWVENEEVTIIVNEDSNVQASVATTANENLKILPGGKLSLPAGVTLTTVGSVNAVPNAFNLNATANLAINGPFNAGLYQVFSGAGLVDFGDGAITVIYPEWWGAIADDSTECATAFNSMIACINAHGTTGMAVSLSDGSYVVSTALTTIASEYGITFRGQGRIHTIFTFAPTINDQKLFTFGTAGYVQASFYKIGGFTIDMSGAATGSEAINTVELSSSQFSDIWITSTCTDSGTVGMRLKGRDMCSFRDIFINMSVDGTPLILAGKDTDYGCDHFNFHNMYLVTKSTTNPLILASGDYTFTSISFTGYQAWVGGARGFYQPAGAGTLTNRSFGFYNVRWETAGLVMDAANTNGVIDINQGVQNLTIQNCTFSAPVLDAGDYAGGSRVAALYFRNVQCASISGNYFTVPTAQEFRWLDADNSNDAIFAMGNDGDAAFAGKENLGSDLVDLFRSMPVGFRISDYSN